MNDDCFIHTLLALFIGVVMTVMIVHTSKTFKYGKLATTALERCELELMRKQHCKITAIPVKE